MLQPLCAILTKSDLDLRGEVSAKKANQNTDALLDAEVETTPTFDLDSIARSSFDRVNSSSAELNKVIAEMRADGENVKTYIPTERTRITDALARAIANSKYANVKGGNRWVLSYLDAVEMTKGDDSFVRKFIAAQLLARKTQRQSAEQKATQSASASEYELSRELNAREQPTPIEASQEAVSPFVPAEKTSLDNANNGDIIKERAEDVKNKRIETLERNRRFGRLFEKKKFKKFSKKYSDAQEQVTIIVQDGNEGYVKIRLDAIGKDKDGNIVIYEFKSSETASFTKNQKAGFDLLRKYGGTIVSKEKGVYKRGDTIPAGTKVMVQTPKGVTDYVDIGKKHA